MGNEFKSIMSQDGSCSVDVGEYAGEYKVRFKVGGVERGTINDAGLFEIDNIKCSGSIQTVAYQVNTVNVMGGNLVVGRGDSLADDMTALDSANLKITGNETFVVNDRLQISNGVDNEFLIVTDASAAPTYVVTRDAAGVYGSNVNPAWKKGTAVANYGASGNGVVWLTASDSNAPFVGIFTHAGSPWSDAVERCRFGNLNGYLGYSSDTYGVGIGSISTGEANLTFDPTNGIRIRQGATNIMTIDMSGNAQISGFTISASDGFHAGSGATRVQMRPGDGFWCGATAQADAPFKVTAAGDLTATSVTMTGAITTASGSSVDGQYIEDATITSSELNGTAFGTLTITSGKIAINTTDALEIQASGSMKMLAGSDIEMYSSPGDFSKLKLYGTTGVHIGDIFAFQSTTCGWYTQESGKALQLGATNYLWNTASITAGTIQLYGYYDANENTRISLVSGNNTSYMTFYVERDGIDRHLVYDRDTFKPSVHKAIDLGASSYAWDNVYAYHWVTVADFYNFDIHDDLAAINGIKGSGKFEEVTGHELIDDDTLPLWLLSKHMKGGEDINEETRKVLKTWKKGETMHDPDGKPYLSLKACISLAWGAIRQLDNKFEEHKKGEI